jgi:Zn-dependent peptidase ImmA (M78 family)
MISFKDFIKEEELDDTGKIIKNFVDFVCDRLEIKQHPKVTLIKDPKVASDRKSFGGYLVGQGKIEVNVGNRHIMDVLRTLAHEIVHHKQDMDNVLRHDSGEDGSEHENEANAQAAVLMRVWGKNNPELFQKAAILAESWKTFNEI